MADDDAPWPAIAAVVRRPRAHSAIADPGRQTVRQAPDPRGELGVGQGVPKRVIISTPRGELVSRRASGGAWAHKNQTQPSGAASKRLLDIADRCPVSRTLSAGAVIKNRLAEAVLPDDVEA